MLRSTGEWLERLGGSRALPEGWAARGDVAIGRGVLWVVLLVLACAFAGHATKFVYVDF